MITVEAPLVMPPGVVWDTLQEGVLVQDADGIRFINKAARIMLGFPEDNPGPLVLPAVFGEEGSLHSWYLVAEQPDVGGEKVVCFTSESGRSWLNLHTVFVQDEANPATFVQVTTICDITAYRRQDNFNLILKSVYEMIMAEEPVDTVLNHLCNQMTSGDFAGVWIGIKMPDGSVSFRGASENICQILGQLSVRWDNTSQGRGSVGKAIRSEKYQVVDNLVTDFSHAIWSKQYAALGMRSLVTFPLRVRGDVIGTITIYASRFAYFTDELVRQLEPIVDQAALAIYFAESRSIERKYRLLMEHSPDVFLFMTATGDIIDVNVSAIKNYGYSRVELLQMNIAELRSFDTMPDLAGHLVLARMKSGVTFETRHVRRNRTVFPVEVSSIGVDIDSNHLIMSVIRDITERRLVQHSLHREKELLKVTLSSIGDAVIATDTGSTVTFMNHVAERLTGWSAAEAAGRSIGEVFQIINETTGEPAEIPVEKVLRDGTIVGLANHTILLSKDRSIFPIADAAAPIRDDSGQIFGVVIVFRDDTERKQAERELRDINCRLADIIEFLPDASFVIDVNGIVISWNKAIEEMTGIRAADIIGSGNYEYSTSIYGYRRPMLIDFALHLDEETAARNLLVFRRAGDTFLGESEGFVTNGPAGNAYLWSAASVLRNSSGQVVGAIETIRDITAHKLAEKSLMLAKEEADRANRVKDDFMAKISHEIRTPLHSILGMEEMLLDSPLSSEQYDYVATMQESSSLLLGMIDDILDFSRINVNEVSLRKIDFPLRALINGIILIVSKKAKNKGLSLNARIDLFLPDMLRGDPVRIRQVLLNLMFNAVKFTEAGGVCVCVSMENQGVDYVIIRCQIEDSGIGIPKAEMSRIFQPFVQMKVSALSTTEGTGLGLTIAKWLVAQMDGEIGLESEVGKGSTFWFNLRLERAKGLKRTKGLEPIRVSDDTALPREVATPRILLAEDNPVNIKMTLLQLAKLGYQANVVTNGRDAVDSALTGEYGLVLMDLQMPVMDGLEAIRTIRAREANLERRVPVVAMTAHAVPGYRAQCISDGADDYLTKPVRLEELRQAIATWIQSAHSEVASTSILPVAQVIDTGVLAEFVDMEDYLTVMRELFDIFKHDTTKRLAKLRQALVENDCVLFWQTAHALKSGSAAVGAQALSSAARDLESQGRAGSMGNASVLLAAAEQEFSRACRVLEGILESGKL